MKIGHSIGILALFAGLSVGKVFAQNVAVKTNLLYDVTATINVGVELGLSPRWTFDLSGNFNGWTMSDNRKWKHWLIQPEARYWFCDRFAGHFIVAHALGGQYNIVGVSTGFNFLGKVFPDFSRRRYQGWFVGGAWLMGTHGYWGVIGIWKPSWVSAISIPGTTVILVRLVAKNSKRTSRTITLAPQRPLSVLYIYSNTCRL